MKSKNLLSIAASLALLAGVAPQVTAGEAKPDRVVVVFQDPDNFTDVIEPNGGTTSENYLAELKSYLQEVAAPRLKEGEKLSVTFTDIDLAGDVRVRPLRDVRIVRAVFTPKMDFTFQLTDASGKVLKEGKRHLTDLDFQNQLGLPSQQSEPLYYDKRLLRDWVNREFSGKP
jgi:hypothetical protein